MTLTEVSMGSAKINSIFHIGFYIDSWVQFSFLYRRRLSRLRYYVPTFANKRISTAITSVVEEC
jgi:hypothetical protein